ncbi:MAG: class I SAM-dependent rRNA methyltransferase [Candidatus Kapabacteria bacterium]|nr:class I SAM-dependent rRNA methyltransferase [Candidatus Kapabacteria bacterium]MDW8011989.1 class I SAM-dependent rRNA methyltransferase [Bacteroidota bacterium]
MQEVRLRAGHEQRVRSGHLWVFSNELQELPRLSPGSIVRVLSAKGESFGVGLYNPHSLIAVRLLRTELEDLSVDFFAERITQALALRQRLCPGEEAYRLVHGEADLLPGLVVDRYGDYLAVQTLSVGMDLRLPTIVEALRHVLPEIQGIVEKNHSRLRTYEQLPFRQGVLYGTIPERLPLQEFGVRMELRLLESQKTGAYLDQRYHRALTGRLAYGLRVLDCFTYHGGFALHAGLHGAREVLGVDSSATAVECARRNAELNSLTQVLFCEADVFDFLRQQVADGAQWDMVILDPPAFAKSRRHVPAAKQGYAELQRLALLLLPSGGYLVTSSCSHHVFEAVFLEVVFTEAARLGRQLRLLYRGTQPPDHPILLSMPETQYLKFFIFQVL